jgi:P27 family predicted phage terminase small subunit
MLEAFCSIDDELAEYLRVIENDGITSQEPIVTPAGHVVGHRTVPHPLIREVRHAEKSLHTLAGSLGFHPAARSRLGLAEIKAGSALEQLMAQRAMEASK